jgi:hypothetical protein
VKVQIAIGDVFGRLTIVGGPVFRNRKLHWICVCACGKERVVAHQNIARGSTSSCGCYRLTRIRETLLVHGQSGIPSNRRAASSEWITWSSMKDRCANPNNNSYSYYGGRGIFVCDRWLESFDNFFTDMGPKPTARHSLDRRNVDGPYSPDNCRWATAIEQAGNKSNNVNLTYGGETHCVAEWCRRLGLKEPLVRKRIKRGCSAEKALTTPRAASAMRRYTPMG